MLRAPPRHTRAHREAMGSEEGRSADEIEARRAENIRRKEEERAKRNAAIRESKKASSAARESERREKAEAEAAEQKKKEELREKREAAIAEREARRGGGKKTKYSKGEVMRLKQVFDEYDKDGSGKISMQEFRESLRTKHQQAGPQVGKKSSLHERQAVKGISIADLSEGVFHEMDRDGSGDVTFEELVHLMYPLASADEKKLMMGWVAPAAEPEAEVEASLSEGAVKEIRAIFKMYDTDKSGKLSAKEVHKALERTALTKEEITELFASYDKDTSDDIDIEEFLELMESTGAFS